MLKPRYCSACQDQLCVTRRIKVWNQLNMPLFCAALFVRPILTGKVIDLFSLTILKVRNFSSPISDSWSDLSFAVGFFCFSSSKIVSSAIFETRKVPRRKFWSIFAKIIGRLCRLLVYFCRGGFSSRRAHNPTEFRALIPRMHNGNMGFALISETWTLLCADICERGFVSIFAINTKKSLYH